MQTILITGGTGLVGEALTAALLAKNYKIIVLTRSLHGKQEEKHLSYALWDIKKQYLDLSVITKADYIIHLAGAGVVDKRWTDSYKKEILESRTRSSQLIVDSLKNSANNVKAVICASATGWYGADKQANASFAESDAAADDFLGNTCKEWEASIEPVAVLGKRLVKLRTGIVLSTRGGALAEFKKPLQFGIAAILGTGRQMVSWIHIDDLCNLYIAAIENEKLSGSYNAVAPNPVSNKKLTVTLAKALNKKLYISLHVPAFILKLIMGQSSIEVLKSTTVNCQKILNTGFKFLHSVIETAIQGLVKR